MGDLGDPAIDDRYVAARQIGPDIGRNVVTIGEERQRVSPVVEQPDRILRLRAGIENGDLATRAAELQRGGETGKAAADDDDVIHGGGLCVVNGGGWRNHRHRSCPFWAAPADNRITLLAAACRKRFASRSSLTARETRTAPTIVERIAMALSVESSP